MPELRVGGRRLVGVRPEVRGKGVGYVGRLRQVGEKVSAAPDLAGPGPHLGRHLGDLALGADVAVVGAAEQGLPVVGQRCWDGGQPGRDVRPVVRVGLRHQVERSADVVQLAGDHADPGLRCARLGLFDLDGEPFEEGAPGSLLTVVGGFDLLHLAEGAARELVPLLITRGREVGERVVEPGDPEERGHHGVGGCVVGDIALGDIVNGTCFGLRVVVVWRHAETVTE